MFVDVAARLDMEQHSVHFATEENPIEYGAMLPESKRYTYFDFYDSKTNKVIEFYGDYWHGNPAKYDADAEISFPNGEIVLAKDIWAKDRNRNEEVKRHRNIDILVIWEGEYREQPTECVNKCVEFLNS